LVPALREIVGFDQATPNATPKMMVVVGTMDGEAQENDAAAY
jgi:hypothetical protein